MGRDATGGGGVRSIPAKAGIQFSAGCDMFGIKLDPRVRGGTGPCDVPDVPDVPS